MTRHARAELEVIFRAALAEVTPQRALAAHVVRSADALSIAGRPLAHGAQLFALAAGKAAAAMAHEFERVAGDRIARGLAVSKDGYALPLVRFESVLAGHPLPDERSASAAARALALVAEARNEDVVVLLLSGGASALLSAPLVGLSVADLRATNDLLLRAGADIAGVNAVRKHLTRVSGGRLAAASAAGRIEVLAICDVPGDDAGVFASGPCAPDASRYADAIAVLQRCGAWQDAPPGVRAHLEAGARGERAESCKPGAPELAAVHHTWVANLARALGAAEAAARARGLRCQRIPEELSGEAREVGARLAAHALALSAREPQLLVVGGETTVQVGAGQGRGGRCQELALAAAIALAGTPGVTLLASGTDGSDGPTDAAGAFADGESVERARRAGRDAAADLATHDSYGFFSAEGGLFRTGPTGTNVADIVLIAVDPTLRGASPQSVS